MPRGAIKTEYTVTVRHLEKTPEETKAHREKVTKSLYEAKISIMEKKAREEKEMNEKSDRA